LKLTDSYDQFDSLDFRIIEALSANARIAFSQLAEQLGVSNSLIHQRVKKLRDRGLLLEPVYVLDPEKLGYQTSAFCQLILAHSQDIREVVEELKKIPEITECVNIAGRYDMMIRIYAQNNSHLRDIVYEKIQSIKGVEGTNTVIAFETAFSRGAPIPHHLEKSKT
jgi:Lrp/AsnC family transcriptional regulator for asnA, asnC and gidA